MDDNGNLDVAAELVEEYMFRVPRAYYYNDYIWPGVIMTPERMLSIQDFDFVPSDVLICTYPKSGTTWASEIVSLLMHKGDSAAANKLMLHERVPWLEMDDSFLLVRLFSAWIKPYHNFVRFLGFKSEKWKPKAKEQSGGVPRVFFTHLPLELLPAKALNGGCRIIYVARNPKDTAVSFFHFHKMARFLGLQKISWNQFFPLYTVGRLYCGSWFEHVKAYWDFNKLNENMMYLKYEDMKRDLKHEVCRISKFLDVDLDEGGLNGVVTHCTFNSMKDNKMSNRQGVWLFSESVSKFMRKGVVGDWKNYFTVAQNSLFDDVYRHRMKDTDLTFEFEPASTE